MPDSNEGNDDFTFYSEIKSSKKSTKEKILDESFRKAEKSKGINNDETSKESIKARPFLKLGVLFIIVAIFALVVINYVPWMFIRFDAEYGTINAFYYSDLETKETGYYLEIDYIFESKCTNCSDFSKNFIGISKDDFSDVPKNCSYASYILIIVGVVFTILWIFYKFRNYFSSFITIIHSSFATANIIFGSFIIFLNAKFLSVHYLSYFNKPFIETSGLSNIIFLFLAPLLLMIIGIGSIIISIIIININLRVYEKKRSLESIEE